ncbi:MAG: cytochrome-c oxidase, cbb3-type subunit III [Pseudomonadota bacterium]|nr:cytochrome-c oxidase, cbb3-type subunit III [Pseudomonadota bacterium]
MSDFISDFWQFWVIGLTLGGIAFCLLLLLKLSGKKEVGPDGKVGSTGHVWDEDLQELNHPLPRWWLQLFYITIVFALGYLALYPGLGSYAGMLGWTSKGQYQAERDAADAQLKPMFDRYAAMDIPTLAKDAEAHAIGQRLFLNNCAQCHGSDGGGQRGFPNLRDQDWLWGGEPENIELTITNGRQGQMPAWGPVLGEQGVKEAVNYVLSLSGSPHDAALATAGKARFDTICAACHGPEGKGNPAVGAPNLTDHIWLYGGTERDITESVTNGRHGQMPAHLERLGAPRVHLLAGYVYSLGH